MSKLLEVKQIIRKIDRANTEINRQKINARSEISNTGYWWKGEAASTFLNKYNEIDRDIQNVKNRLDDLRYYTNKLVKLLEDEERENKQAANKIRW